MLVADAVDVVVAVAAVAVAAVSGIAVAAAVVVDVVVVGSDVDVNAIRPTCRLYWFSQHILHSKCRKRRCGRCFRATCRLYRFSQHILDV